MDKKSQLIINLAGQAYKTNNDIKRQKDEIKAQQSINPKYSKEVDDHLYKLFAALIIALIAFLGVEPMKVIYRRNFGKGTVNLFVLGICSLFFVLYGLICLAAGIAQLFPSFKDDFLDMLGGSISFILSGLFYFFLAHYSMKRGVGAAMAAQTNLVPHGYEGDSDFFAFLFEKGWKQNRVQMFIEPLFAIGLGIIISLFFNVIAGLPLIACGLSMWVYMIVKVFFLDYSTQARVVSINEETKESGEFSDVEIN